MDNQRDMAAVWQKKLGRKYLNSIKKGKPVEFTISVEDVTWPETCPVLGIPLDYISSVGYDASPSFDRVDPTKGYVPGNVRVISNRANRIKNDGTAEEHRKIADYIDSHIRG